MPGTVFRRAVRAWLLCLLSCSFLSFPVTAQSLPDPWRARDIGHPVLEGWNSYTSGVFEVDGAGTDTWGTSDQFRFVYQRVLGDVDVVARVISLTPTDPWAKAGLMIRASLSRGAAQGYALVSASRGIAFQRRTQGRGLTSETPGQKMTAPCWLRLVRIGATVTAYSSVNGLDWQVIGSDNLELGTSVYVGLAVTSHSERIRATAAFGDVAVRTSALPPPLMSADIGEPGVAGAAFFSSGGLTVLAAGVDIWGTEDQFHFVHQPISGDMDVSVRVPWLHATHDRAKVGVMVRESLTPGSRHATALLSMSTGYAFQWRKETSGLTEQSAGGQGGAPGWLRLVRTGSRFEAFRSADGRDWRSMGVSQIDMARTVYVGIAVTSHDSDTEAAAGVDHLQISGGSIGPASGPSGVIFQASADHDSLVISYKLKVFAAADGTQPVAALDLGKPAPDAEGEISVNAPAFFSALTPGDYEAVVEAIGFAGASSGRRVPFTR